MKTTESNHSFYFNFFEVVYGSEMNGLLEGRAIDKNSEKLRDRIFSSDINEIISWIEKNKNLANLYFGVSTRKKGSQKGEKEDCYGIPGFWVDLDFKDFPGGEEEARKRLAQFPFKPTIVVRTGGGLHVYWIFKEIEVIENNVAFFEDILRGVIESVQGDKAACDISRVLRIPGTLNFPNTKKRKSGRTET